jgi:hypothetical protein
LPFFQFVSAFPAIAMNHYDLDDNLIGYVDIDKDNKEDDTVNGFVANVAVPFDQGDQIGRIFAQWAIVFF